MSLALLKKRPIALKTPTPPRPEPLVTKKQLQNRAQCKRARARRKEKVARLENDVVSRDDKIRQLKASVATLTAQNQAFAQRAIYVGRLTAVALARDRLIGLCYEPSEHEQAFDD